jgi:hypothetical protein
MSCGLTGAGIATSVCENGEFGPFGPCSELSARSIVAGEMHSCVLLEDDSPYCWGANQSGQLDAPTGERFSELVAVSEATCGLRFDGTVTCWGRVGTNTFDDFEFRHLGRIGPSCPIGLTEEGLLRGSVSCGEYPSLGDAETFQTSSSWRCGATPSGSARCNGTEYRVDGAHFVEAAQGYGRTADGRVYEVNGRLVPGTYRRVLAHDRWNGSTQLCLIDEAGRPSCEIDTTALPPGDDYVDLTFGRYHTCGRRSNGQVSCVSQYPTFQNPAPTTGGFTDIEVGYDSACASREDGTLTCWGGLADDVTPADPFDSFSVHFRRACGLRDGLVTCWGLEVFPLSNLPGYLQGAHFANVDVGDRATCGVLADTIDAGKALCWGYYWYDSKAPSYWLEREHAPYRRASVGRNYYYCLESESGDIRCGRPPEAFSIFAAGTTFASWVAGYEVACGLTPEGTALCSHSSRTPPAESFSQLDVNSVACGVTLDERIVCWPADRYGITHFPTDASYQKVGVGEEFACGLRTDGTIACWGFYDFGQADVPGPAQIPQ